MAKFSKGQYVILERCLAEAYRFEKETSPSNAAVVANVAVSLTTYLGADNSKSDREHFIKVVRGERPLDSRPPRSNNARS